MIFEDALAELRKGKKIRHPYFENNVYLMGCYVTLKFDFNDTFEKAKERGMSIVKCLGDRQHPDMQPKWKRECESELHSFPHLNLFLIMSDNWEAFD